MLPVPHIWLGRHPLHIRATIEKRLAKGDMNSPMLRAAIENAKAAYMPKENIERAVAKGSGADGATLEEVLFEGYGPGGVAMVIAAVTDNNNRTAPEIRHIFTKAGLALGTPGSAAWAFTKTAEGYVPQSPVELNDHDGEKLANLIEALEDNEDVQDVYTTADSADAE